MTALLRSLPALGLAAVLCCAVVAGCSEPAVDAPATSSGAPQAPAALPPAEGSDRLADVCPATVVVQNAWEPEAEQAAVYQLLGPGYQLDGNQKRVTGPLVVDGKDTGVAIEIRQGGAAIGFVAVPAQMYVDRSITLGAVPTDLAVATSQEQPVTAVVAPLNKSPLMVMWDPASHPDWTGIADIGRSGSTVQMFKGNPAISLLTGRGLLTPAQIDTGYTGAPTRFVSDPTIAQQGYVTTEPYVYENELSSWRKPVRYQLVADVGFDVYPEAYSVRTGDLETLSPCLERLVPILQRAQAAYLADPAPTNKLIVDAVAANNSGWTYSAGVADYAAATLREQRIVADDSTGPLGGMDPARVQAVIDTYTPLLAVDGVTAKPGLTSADIATDEFLDPGVTLD